MPGVLRERARLVEAGEVGSWEASGNWQEGPVVRRGEKEGATDQRSEAVPAAGAESDHRSVRAAGGRWRCEPGGRRVPRVRAARGVGDTAPLPGPEWGPVNQNPRRAEGVG